MMSFALKHIENMKAYEAGEQPTSPKIVKLNTNENAYSPPESIKKVFEGLDLKDLRNYPPIDKLDLVALLAERNDLSLEEVCFGNGLDEIISAIFRAFIGNEKELLLTEYTYSAYFSYAEMYRSKMNILKMKDFKIDLSQVGKAKFQVFLLTNPNAPTGIALDNEAIVKMVKKHPDKLFIVDEAYKDFNDEEGMSLVEKVREVDNLMVVRTLSKGYSLAGVRVGYVFASSKLVANLKKVLDPYNLSFLSQKIAWFALSHEEYFQHNNRKIIATRKSFVEKISQMNFTTLPSKANFVLTSPPSGQGPKETQETTLAKEIFLFLKSENILVRYFSRGELANYLRMTIGTDEQMNKVINALEKFFTLK